MNLHRRSFLRTLVSGAGAATLAHSPGVAAQDPHAGHKMPPPAPKPPPKAPPEPSSTGAPRAATPARRLVRRDPPTRVFTPDLPKLPFTTDKGVKVFKLIAEPVRTEFLPGRPVDCWGFNGSMPGPTIEATEGDRVRIIVENRLPEVFAPHWHGLEVPHGQDGAPGLSQDPIPPGGSYAYEFTLVQNGTFFYHSHMPMQEMMGMIGLFIIHPRDAHDPPVDRDFGIILQGWAILPNNTVPNTLAMEFNWLTMNGKAGPATTPMLVRRGERVRIRLVNLGMDHHPIHLHGNTFYTVGTEAGRLPRSTWEPGNTVLVGVAQSRDIEFEANNPGDWMLHCHLPHHMMNQMASMVGPLTDTRFGGLPVGIGMEEGMGVIRQGHALSEELGASFGRTLGSGDFEKPITNLPLDSAMQHAGHQQEGMVAPNAHRVKGYPQDMWMVMDDLFAAKPETYGLRRGWTGVMMGMMTMIRVLEPAMFDKIAALLPAQLIGGRA